MKKIKYGLLSTALLIIASFSQLNAQPERHIIDFQINHWVQCANDGAGENVVGMVDVLLVSWPDGSLVAHPMGGYAVGDVTGIKYQIVGATIWRHNYDEDGSGSTTWVNRFHFAGKGTHYYSKDTYRAVMSSGGELDVIVDKHEVICK